MNQSQNQDHSKAEFKFLTTMAKPIKKQEGKGLAYYEKYFQETYLDKRNKNGKE